MIYLGSKNRIAKIILPLMLEKAKEKNITTWVETCVGGANLIDKVPLNFKRVGIDLNPHTIAALIGVRDLLEELPKDVSEDYYKSLRGRKPDPITSLIRFGASFGGKFEAGYARSNPSKGTPRNHWREAVRNAEKQSPHIQDVEFINGSYSDFSEFKNCLIYCDPPYEGTTGYSNLDFDYLHFWEWCRNMSEYNLVFVSEYKAPGDFLPIWEGPLKTNFSSTRSSATHTATEKLFVYALSEML